MALFTYPLDSAGVLGFKNGAYPDSLIQTVDSWEDNDIAEYSGNTGSFSLVTSPVSDGSYALQASSSGTIHSTSGLNAYPSAGDTWKIDLQFSATAPKPQPRWCYDGANGTFYQTGLNQGELRIWRYDGAWNLLVGGAVSVSTGTWHTLELVHGSSGSITATLYDSTGTQLQQVSATDTNYTSGGIGIKDGDGVTTYDNWRIV